MRSLDGRWSKLIRQASSVASIVSFPGRSPFVPLSRDASDFAEVVSTLLCDYDWTLKPDYPAIAPVRQPSKVKDTLQAYIEFLSSNLSI